MFRKMLFFTTIASILVVTAFLILGWTGQAFAQEENPPADSTCISCHEDQYYLHDTGNWYCLTETKVGCTECHRGYPDMRIKECAHEGLIAHPLANDAAVCQNCHPDDYQTRVHTYASIAGIRPTPRPYAGYTPQALISQSEKSAGEIRLLHALPPEAWQKAGLGFFGVAFLGVFLFACRCWKIDHGA
jgi:cytochrome c553